MSNWYQMHERGAGKFRMEILWWVYRAFGIGFLRFVVKIVAGTIALFAPKVRATSNKYRAVLNEYETNHNLPITKISAFGHICTFATSVVDKMSAICDNKTPLKFTIENDTEWQKLQNTLDNGGVFFICSHMGNIETLSAMPGGQDKKMNAFMNIESNKVFRDFMARHAKYTNTTIHPTENIGVAMAGEMYDALKRGELVMMAGDRISPNAPDKVINVKILDKNCALPMGVFRFARACDAPIFAIVNVKTERNTYRAFVKQLDTKSTDTMATGYAEFLERMILRYPKQWFNFFDFFNR